MAVNIPMGVLGWVSDADITPLVTKVNQARQLLKELGAEGEKNDKVRNLFREMSSEADKLNKSYKPLIADSKLLTREMRELGDAVGKNGTSLKDAAARYKDLSAAMAAQLKTLNPLSREYTTLEKIMKSVEAEAKQLEAAQKGAAAAYKTDEIKRYGTELKQLVTGLKDTGSEFKRLSTEQRALRFDVTGLRDYRGEQEKLQGSFDGIGRGLGELKGKLQDYARELSEGSSEHKELVRVMNATENATQTLAREQERATQAYRGAEIEQFTARLRDVDKAQRENLISTEQAARAVQQIQTEFRDYAAALGVAERELGTFSRSQLDAGRSADAFAGAQERAARAFDASALRSFVGELQNAVQAYDKGEIGAEGFTRAVSDSQGRLREYGSTLNQNSREFADFNKLLDVSERALLEMSAAAERSSKGFDPAALTRYGRELGSLEVAQRELVRGTELLERAQRSSQDAFAQTQLDKFRGELEALGRALRDGSGNFEVLARAATTTQRDLLTYLGTLDKSSQEHADLSRALELTGRALTDLGAAAQRSSKGFDTAGIDRFTGELERLDAAQKDLGNGLIDLAGASDRLSASFDGSRLTDFRTEIERLIQSQRDGRATFDETGRAVQEVQTRFRDYVSTLNLTAREQEVLNRALDGVDTALKNVGQAAQTAARGFDAAPIRAYTGELEGLQSTGRELGTAFSGIEGELNQLDASLRDSGQAANLSARELTALQNVERELESATTRLVTEQGKLEAAFRVDALKTFRSDLEQIVTANKNGLTSFEQTTRAIDALQGRMREFAGTTTLSVNEQRTLASVMGQTESAALRLANAAERAGNSFEAEKIRQQVGALKDLELQLERGEIAQEQFSEAARGIGSALQSSRDNLEAGTRSYIGYTGALTKVEGSLARAEGRVRTFGYHSGVTAGISDQLQNVLYRLGPAGEAMGVAMFTASSGMAGAATSAKILNIALAAGVVGAVIGTAVAAKVLFDTSRQLDTAMVDVSKSTNLTREEMLGLTRELQGVSLATGTPTKDLLDLAAVAGQMGVTGVKNVAEFTKQLNILTITTDIIGEEGARQMAAFINVTKDANTSTADSATLVTNALVALGNNVAGGEAKILAMAQRLGVLKSASNLSQTDILGLAGGFVDLGLTAERAEISVTGTFTAISQAASQGGAKLDTFAEASGLTADEFKRLAQESPADAFLALIGGLRAAQDAGQDLNPVLDKLAGNNKTLRNVLLTLVGGYASLEKTLGISRDEAERMSAASDELGKRLGSLDGIGQRVLRVFGLVKNELALRLIPTFTGGLNSVLDFSRAVAGLEPDGRAVGTFATNAGSSIRTFIVALQTGERVTGSFASEVGAAFKDVGDFLDTLSEKVNQTGANLGNFVVEALGIADGLDEVTKSVKEGGEGLTVFGATLRGATGGALTPFQAANRESSLAVDNFFRSLVGLPPIISDVADGTREVAGAQKEATITARELGSAAQEYQYALDNEKTAIAGTKEELTTYLERLELIKKVYPELALKIQPFIDQTKASLALIEGGGAAYVASTDKLGSFAAAQEKYAKLLNLSLPDAKAFLAQLEALRDAYPHVTEKIAPLIAGTKERIATLKEEGDVSEDVGRKTITLAQANATYVNIQKLALPQLRTYLQNLRDLRDAHPELAKQINVLIDATKQQIATSKDSNDANAAQAGSLGALRDQRQTLLDTYNNAPVGSAAQAEALQAIRAIDSQIEAGDRLSANIEEIGRIAADMAQNIADSYREGMINAQTAVGALVDKIDELKAQKRELLASGDYDAADLRELDADLEATEAQLAAVSAESGITGESLKRAFAEAEAASERYHENLDLTRAAQEQLNDVSGLTADQARDMAKELKDAASGTGELGQEARAAQLNLLDLADRIEAAEKASELYHERLEAVREAQDLLADSAGSTGKEARAMAAELDDAAQGSGRLGEEARTAQENLLNLADKLDQAEKAAKLYGENLETVRDAQEALGDSAGMTGDDARKLAAELDEAAQGSGRLGEEARTAQANLLNLADKLDAAEVAAERYGENLEAVRAAQDTLADSAGLTSEEARKMAAELETASEGTGKLGTEAEAAQTNLENLADRLEVAEAAAEKYATNLETVRDAQEQLADTSKLSADAALQLVGDLDAAVEGSGRLGEQARLAQDQLTAFAFAQNVAGDAAVNLESVVDSSGEAVSGFDAIMVGLGTAAQDAGVTLRLFGDENQYLETMIAATERAIVSAAAEYGENSRTVEELQNNLLGYRTELNELGAAEKRAEDATTALDKVMDELATSVDKTPEDFEAMGVALKNAAEEGVITAERLKELVAQLDALQQRAADGKALEGYGVIIGQVGALLASQTGGDPTKTGMAAAISGIGAAATEASGLMDAFAGDTASQLGAAGQVFGIFADTVRAVFGEELPAEVEIGFAAIETGIQGATAGLAIGGPLGAAIGGGIGLILGFFTASSKAAAEAAAEEEERQKEAAEAHRKFVEDFKKAEAERVQAIREATAEVSKLRKEESADLAQLKRDVNDARLEFAKANGADEGLVFISETILAVREQSRLFKEEMALITKDKNEFIAAYLAAHPGSGRGEAEAAAEAIFGPQREELKTQFALTSATILLEAEKTAKDLGLSQSEFYEAVFAGNTDLLGNMTEGQRLAIVQFVEVAREMGIELPAALNEAYENINGANESGGNTVVEGLEAQRAVVQNGYDNLKSEWKDRSAELREQIKEAKGQEKADLEQQFQEEKADYERRAGELSTDIKDYNDRIAEAERDGTATRRTAAQENVDSLKTEKETFKAEFATRAEELKGLIANSSGETRAAYIGMFVEETQAYETGLRERNTAINAANDEAAASDVAGLEKRRDNLKSAYDADVAKLMEGFAEATITERLAIQQRVDDLTVAYEEADGRLVSTIEENQDGPATALAKNAQLLVDGIQEEIRTTNEAWAIRAQELDTLIANSSGVTQQAYIRLREEEGAAYQTAIGGLIDDLTAANQNLLDAQDRGADDFAAAQAEVGRKEQEALTGVFAILRQVLGEDAQVIIDLIQGTYNSRRAAYLAEGQATAEAAGQANQGELEQLQNVFAILRQVLGPDAQTIIDLIKGTYNARAEAHNTGGDAAANAAGTAAEKEQQSVRNINELLRQIFGPDAQAIIDLINEMYTKKAAAHETGGTKAGGAATGAAESEAQSVRNINQLLRQIFGPDAQQIIDLINNMYKAKGEAHAQGGAQAGAGATEGANTETNAVNQGTQQTAGALTERDKTLSGLLAQDNISPALRAQAQALQAEFISGANMTEAEIAAAREKVAAALVTRDERIKTLVAGGSTLAEATRIADQELSNTFAAMGAEVAGSVEQNTAQVGGALSAREQTLAGLLAQDNLSPALRAQAQALQAEFISGANLTQAEIAAARDKVATALQDRESRIAELVAGGSTLAEATRQADQELANTFAVMGAEIADGATTGGNLAAQGVSSSQQTVGSSIETFKSGLATIAGGISANVSPTIVQEHQKLVDAFTQGAQASGGGIDAAERLQIEKMLMYQRNLEAEAGGITNSVSPAVIAAHAAISGSFGTGASTVNTSITSGINLLTGAFEGGGRSLTSAIGSLYGDVTSGLNTGSSGFVGSIANAYQAEQNKFDAESNAMEQLISRAKGDEKAELITQYNAIKEEHAKRSREYENQIGASGDDEKRGLIDAARLVSGALGDMGDDEKKAAELAYKLTKEAHDRASAAYRKIMGDSANDEKKAAILAGGTTSGGLGDMKDTVVNKTQSVFSDQGDAYNTGMSKYIGVIDGQKSLLESAFDRIANLIKNFKYPKPPTPPSPSASGNAGIFGLMTAFEPPQGLGSAYAMDAAPTYTSATAGFAGDAQSFAADTLDLFGSRSALKLTVAQERVQTIRLEPGNFGNPFAGADRMFETWTSSLMDIARFERKTAEMNREAILQLTEYADKPRSIYDAARRPPPRKV